MIKHRKEDTHHSQGTSVLILPILLLLSVLFSFPGISRYSDDPTERCGIHPPSGVDHEGGELYGFTHGTGCEGHENLFRPGRFREGEDPSEGFQGKTTGGCYLANLLLTLCEVDQEKPSRIREKPPGGVKKGAQVEGELVPCRGPLRVGVQPAAPHGPERRVREDDIHLRGERRRRKVPHVALNHRDPARRAVFDDVFRSQRGQLRLDLDGPQVAERFPMEQDQRDDPAPGPDLQEVVLRPALDEVRQEGSVEGEAITAAGLANADLPVKETGR
ncbi:MAG: hypothetical protein KA419_10495 [Acidobacteria bacterium]|nr:hypothetical protein [Acidobacteriota bacterium]